MRLTILRGISGAGKSTWIKTHAAGALVASADHLFMEHGTYRYDRSRLAEAHARCFRVCLDALTRQEPWIVIDNTNVMAWEFSPYVLAGEAFGYEVELLTLACDPGISQARKQLVPPDQLRRSFEALEAETRNLPARFRGIHRTIDACVQEPSAVGR